MARRKKKNKKILLVDDNHETLESISFLLKLRDESLEIVGSPSAEQGLFDLRGADLLITDLRLPGMDGVELIKRARRKNADLPAIIMSGMDQKFAKKQYGEFEVNEYVQKPYKPDELVNIILNVLWDGNIPEAVAATGTAPVAQPDVDVPEPRSDIYHPPLSADSIARLERLQSQTNAHQVVLWGLDGAMIYLFDESERKAAEKLAKPAINSITGGLEMLVRSGSTPTQMISVLDGEPNEIVLAYIKSRMDYCLAIVVDNDKSQTKLSTVWGAMQRTVADLTVRLNRDDISPPAQDEAEIPAPVEPVAEKEPPAEPEVEPDPIASDDELANLIDDLVGDEISDDELDDFWGIEAEASDSTGETVEEITLEASPEEAADVDDVMNDLLMMGVEDQEDTLPSIEIKGQIDAEVDPELAALLADVEKVDKDDIPGLVDMLIEKDTELVDERWEEIKGMLGLDSAADDFWETAVQENERNRAKKSQEETDSGMMSYKEALENGLLEDQDSP
ncbi:MAG: response regulator [Chloroflexota bacterium]